jgi:hypothetical protein
MVGISVGAASTAGVSALSSAGELPPKLHAIDTSMRRRAKNTKGVNRIFFIGHYLILGVNRTNRCISYYRDYLGCKY